MNEDKYTRNKTPINIRTTNAPKMQVTPLYTTTPQISTPHTIVIRNSLYNHRLQHNYIYAIFDENNITPLLTLLNTLHMHHKNNTMKGCQLSE